ncbi:MAG: pyrroloquinoline quinone biosynthesis protein C [Candidatus Melainabacteria bacterium]|nr:MAG: pyrroloquinoline quinone biosynthesis protein C [Candidatus Melainabacteria bacterium]
MKVDQLLTEKQFVDELNDIGEQLYHHKHPFHIRMHEGSLTPGQLRIWVRNRFYYQTILPIKDAIIVSKLPDSENRRQWIRRIIDQDGDGVSSGGIESWIRLGEGMAVARAEMLDVRLLGAVAKDAVDSYVDFCRERSWLEAVAASLTELFAPKLITDRMEVFKRHYAWIQPQALEYFFTRLKQAPRDSEHALRLVLANATNANEQRLVTYALRFKCRLLWRLLDGIEEDCRRETEYI